MCIYFIVSLPVLLSLIPICKIEIGPPAFIYAAMLRVLSVTARYAILVLMRGPICPS
jgi:hypothetical protein